MGVRKLSTWEVPRQTCTMKEKNMALKRLVDQRLFKKKIMALENIFYSLTRYSFLLSII